jgi:hypothetical protein
MTAELSKARGSRHPQNSIATQRVQNQDLEQLVRVR